MSTCRAILLEVKRRVGDTVASVPGEVDLMAHLNSALRMLWNYGGMINSSKLHTKQTFTGSGNEITFDGLPMKIVSVFDNTAKRLVLPINVVYDGYEMWNPSSPRYLVNGDIIELLPVDSYASHDVSVLYIPEFTELTDRDADIPFPSYLDQYVIDMTLSALAGSLSVEAVNSAVQSGNALTDYFRGGARYVTGTPPW